jgi:hypothetical protein
MTTLRRALAIGVAFGLAAASVETALTLVPFLERRFGPGPVFQAQVAALQILLGALLGLAAAPLLHAPGGRLLHVLALGLAWWGLERWVALGEVPPELDAATREQLRALGYAE